MLSGEDPGLAAGRKPFPASAGKIWSDLNQMPMLEPIVDPILEPRVDLVVDPVVEPVAGEELWVDFKNEVYLIGCIALR